MTTTIGILLFDDVTALDAVGPYEVLHRLPGANVRWVGVERGIVTAKGGLKLVVDTALDECPSPDIVIVPGGLGARTAMRDERIVTWIRHAHDHSRWTTSVCTGALVLGAAGLLKHLHATTHWTATDQLGELGASLRNERVVRSGKIMTSAGVSAGIDMALTLAAEEAGEDVARAIQLLCEYAPDPPFDSGAPSTATDEIVRLAQELSARNV